MDATRRRSWTSSSDTSRAAINDCSARSLLDTEDNDVFTVWLVAKGRGNEGILSSSKGSSSTTRPLPLSTLMAGVTVEVELERERVELERERTELDRERGLDGEVTCALKKGLLALLLRSLSVPKGFWAFRS